MAKRSKEEIEMIRRGYYGDLIKLYQRRYGNELPDDDAGREFLFDLLVLASFAMVNPTKKMSNSIGLMAEWMSAEEADDITDTVNRMPLSERWHIAKMLGERHRVTYAEHESIGLKNITPCDKTAEELAELRKVRKREREKMRRHQRGAKSRPEYRAQFTGSLNQTEPWIPLGISRATFFRNKAKQRIQAA